MIQKNEEKIYIGKYEFEDEATLDEKIAALGQVEIDGNLFPSHMHSITKLGHVYLKKPVYGEDETIIEEGIKSDKYHVDVEWVGLKGDPITEIVEGEEYIIGYEEADHPYGWKGRSIDFEEGQGLHSFKGKDFQKYKFKS